MFVNLGDGEKVCGTVFDFYPPQADRVVRSNAVVVYDNPSERISGDATG